MDWFTQRQRLLQTNLNSALLRTKLKKGADAEENVGFSGSWEAFLHNYSEKLHQLKLHISRVNDELSWNDVLIETRILQLHYENTMMSLLEVPLQMAMAGDEWLRIEVKVSQWIMTTDLLKIMRAMDIDKKTWGDLNACQQKIADFWSARSSNDEPDALLKEAVRLQRLRELKKR